MVTSRTTKEEERAMAQSLLIIIFEIKSLKDVNVEAKDIVKFEFGTTDFNLYGPQNICKDYCARVYFCASMRYAIGRRRTLLDTITMPPNSVSQSV